MGADPALFRMLRAGRGEGRDLDRALDALAQVLGRHRVAERLGPQFTCLEANLLAWVLIASRHTDAAVSWMDGHAAGDDEDAVHGGDGFDARRYLTGRRR